MTVFMYMFAGAVFGALIGVFIMSLLRISSDNEYEAEIEMLHAENEALYNREINRIAREEARNRD